MKSPYFLRARAIAAPIMAFALLALFAAPVSAEGRQVKNTTRTNINQNTNVNRNTNVNNNTNVNVNRNTNVNVNRNVNVNVNHGYYGGVYYNNGPSVAAVVATAIVVGAIVNSLPPGCTTIMTSGITYHNCGGTYYQPRYQGSSVTYVVVTHP